MKPVLGAFERLAFQAVQAVEDERRVPRAAVGRAVARRGDRVPGRAASRRATTSATATYTTPASASCAGAPPTAAGQAEPGEQRERRQRRQRLQQLDVEGQSERDRGSEQPAGGAASRWRAPRSSSASTISAIITASIVSLRAVITSIGSTASASAAARPARTPKTRRTAANSSGTASVPASACGSFSAVELQPKSFDARDLQPEVHGRLVDRDRARGLDRAEEEVVPGERHAAHGAVVEGVAHDLPEVRQAQRRRAQRDQRHGQPAAAPEASQRRPGSAPRRRRVVAGGRSRAGSANLAADGETRGRRMHALPRDRAGDLKSGRQAAGGYLPLVSRRGGSPRRHRRAGDVARRGCRRRRHAAHRRYGRVGSRPRSRNTDAWRGLLPSVHGPACSIQERVARGRC